MVSLGLLTGSSPKSPVTAVFALSTALLSLGIFLHIYFLHLWQGPEYTSYEMAQRHNTQHTKPMTWNSTIQVIPQIQLEEFTKRPPIPRQGPEIRQVVFAKVHKAASSTLQNIFLRFALDRNLSVLLPKQLTSIREESKEILPQKVVPHPEGKMFYDILCNHVLYDEQEISKYFKDTAVRIAIVREPLKQSLSALKYFFSSWDKFQALHKGFNKHKKDPIHGFLNNPQDFYVREAGPSHSYINNRMSVDLGFELTDFEKSKRNETKVKTFLHRLEAQFDAVLVADYFDQSLILMRRILRWPMKAILYLKVNVGTLKKLSSVWHKQPNLNSQTLNNFRKWDAIDFQLYHHFLDIFLKRINKELLFNEELNAFRSIQMDVKYFCMYNAKAKTLDVPKGQWTDAFTLSRTDCKLMTMSEPNFVEMVRQTQTKRYEEFKRNL